MKDIEIWKDVVGFEDYFQVSNCGNVFSKRTSRILSQNISKNGYWQVSTRVGGRKGKAHCFKVHRLVAEAFLEKPEHLKEEADKWFYGKIPVNHIDGNKLNNQLNNLEWCTYKENSRHAVDEGLFVPFYGCDSSNSKFTEDQIKYIREVYKPNDKEFGAKALSERYKVHRSVISRIVNRKRYKNID